MSNKQEVIKRISRNPEKFDVLELLDAVACVKKLKFSDENDLIKSIRDSIKINKTQTMLYGKQTEAMFASVVASLNKVEMIKKEDGGCVFYRNDNIEIPDYKIILNSGKQMFVEVKNCYLKKFRDDFRLKNEYLSNLSKYADLMHTDLKIAIYWAKFKYWTLVSKEDFSKEGNYSTISFPQAMKQNKMSILGDMWIGTTPPLSIKLYAGQNNQITKGNNLFEITIENVELNCDGKLITKDNEIEMAFKLILFGDWEEEIIPVLNNTNQIEHIEFRVNPIEKNQEQGFNMIGTLSSIISKQYMLNTIPNGQVERFSSNIAPEKLSFTVPEDYKGDVLKLWQFIVN